LRLGRDSAGIKQEQLATALDVSCQQVQKYESGENRISASSLYVAAQFLGVPVAFFFDGFVDGAVVDDEELTRRSRTADFWQSAEGRIIADAFTRLKDGNLRKHFLGLLQGLVRKKPGDSEM